MKLHTYTGFGHTYLLTCINIDTQETDALKRDIHTYIHTYIQSQSIKAATNKRKQRKNQKESKDHSSMDISTHTYIHTYIQATLPEHRRDMRLCVSILYYIRFALLSFFYRTPSAPLSTYPSIYTHTLLTPLPHQ